MDVSSVQLPSGIFGGIASSDPTPYVNSFRPEAVAPGRFGPALYLLMGWLSPLLIWSLWPIMPGLAMGLMAAGGLLYTTDVIFYKAEEKAVL